MLQQLVRRRLALLGIGTAMVAPGLALAARPKLTLATGALPPLTSAPGHTGFLDALAQEVFGRIEVDASVLRLPVERALVNANAGIEDGDMFRAAGFEKDYPNLVQVPEKVLDFEQDDIGAPGRQQRKQLVQCAHGGDFARGRDPALEELPAGDIGHAVAGEVGPVAYLHVGTRGIGDELAAHRDVTLTAQAAQTAKCGPASRARPLGGG